MEETKKFMQRGGWKKWLDNRTELMWQKKLSDNVLLEVSYYKDKDSWRMTAMELENPWNKEYPVFGEIYKCSSEIFREVYTEVMGWLRSNKKI